MRTTHWSQTKTATVSGSVGAYAKKEESLVSGPWNKKSNLWVLARDEMTWDSHFDDVVRTFNVRSMLTTTVDSRWSRDRKFLN